jgi:hypothetical protein
MSKLIKPPKPTEPSILRVETSGTYGGFLATYNSPVIVGWHRIDLSKYTPNIIVRRNSYVRPGIIGNYVTPAQQSVFLNENNWFVKITSVPNGSYFFDGIISQTALNSALPLKGTSPFSNPSNRTPPLIVYKDNQGPPQIDLYTFTSKQGDNNNYYNTSRVFWHVRNATSLSCVGLDFSYNNLSITNSISSDFVTLKPKKNSNSGWGWYTCTFEAKNIYGTTRKTCTQYLRVVGNPAW